MWGSILRPFFKTGTKKFRFVFSYLLHYVIYVRTRGHCESSREVPEDSWVLRVRHLWFPTSKLPRHLAHPLRNDLVLKISRVNQVLTQPAPVTLLLHFVLSFSTKRAWPSGSKHFKRCYGGKLRQNMVDSWHFQDRVVPEGMSQVASIDPLTNKSI